MCTYAFVPGGGETFPLNLANIMSSFGYTVTVMSFNGEKCNYDIKRKLYPRIPVVTRVGALREICTNFDIDIIHSHHACVDMTILGLFPKKSKIQKVISLHGMYESMPKEYLASCIKKISNNEIKFVYTAKKNKHIFDLNGINTTEFVKIPNMLSSIEINDIDLSKYHITEDSFVVTVVSRAIAEKGWEDAIRAINYARELSSIDIHLLLIGEGPMIESLNCYKGGHIHFLGFRDNIRDYYKVSDIGLLPSKFPGESYPLVLIDCIFAGTPFLATDIAEIKDMLTCNEGVAGDVFGINNWELDYKEIGELILRYVNDSEYVAQKRTMVSKVRSKFNSIDIAKLYDAVYRR